MASRGHQGGRVQANWTGADQLRRDGGGYLVRPDQEPDEKAEVRHKLAKM